MTDELDTGFTDGDGGGVVTYMPAVLLGFAAMFVLTDTPANTRFLTPAEKQVVIEDMDADRRNRTSAASRRR